MSVATPEWSPPLGGAPGEHQQEGQYLEMHRDGEKQAPPAPATHPFADTTNRPSVLFAPSATPPSPVSLDGAISSGGAGGLGLGTPFVRDDRRDITVKPPRRVAPAPPPSTSAASPTRLPRPTHRSTKSTSSALPLSLSSSTSSTSLPSAAAHAPIPAPVYPVTSSARTFTSAPMQLSRSQSLRSSLSSSTSSNTSALNTTPQPPLSPTISGGLARRLSVSSLSSQSEDEDDNGEEEDDLPPRQRPLARRSESLPSFPPLEVLEAREREEKERARDESRRRRQRELEGLPPNPKLWLPSHLSLYLSHTLSHPSPSSTSTTALIAADITAFIRTSRLSGRTFLRLRDSDFEELGINVRWRAALTEAREKLRREAVAASEGGFTPWGFQGGGEEDEPVPNAGQQRPQLRRRPSVDVEGSADEDEQGKEEWKRSWRSLGGKTPGRVRGLRDAFETGVGRRGARVEAVEEVSEPGSSPVKGGTAGKRSSWAEGWRSYADARHRRGDSTESAFSVGSAASVDSLGGRYEGLSTSRSSDDDLFDAPKRRDPSLSNDSDRGQPFPFATPDPTPPRSRFSTDSGPSRTMTATKVPQLELDLASAPTSPSPARTSLPALGGSSVTSPALPEGYQSSISLHPTPYALVRRASADASSNASVPTLASLGLQGKEGGTLVRREGKGSGRVSFEAFSRSSRDGADGLANDDDDEEDDEDGAGEPTVRPPRSGSGASAFSSEGMEWPTSPTSAAGGREKDPRVGGLAELFGLEVPKTRGGKGEVQGEQGGEGEAELATLFVPAREGQGRKGSLVIVKKSQLTALHRRLDEVESLVSSALSGSGSAPVSLPSSPSIMRSHEHDEDGERRYYDETWREERMTGLEGGEGMEKVELDGAMGRVEGLESRARHLVASLSPSSSAPGSPSTALTTPSSSAAALKSPSRRRQARRRVHSASSEDEDDGSLGGIVWPEGWKQLSGYVVAASIGIGIVAGEVVLAQVFGMRRR
ncbi:hypothetical protein JCM6882_004565 [Rhodosporidiobolus microsporus]